MDWPSFLDQNNIPYATAGPNVSRGNLVTRCVWCGHDDDSMHLSISLEGRGYRCWRHPAHRGKNPARLVQALLGCSWERACQLAGVGVLVAPDDFMAKIETMLVPKAETKPKSAPLPFPKEFKPFKNLPSAKPYINYLTGRKIPAADIMDTLPYDISYCTQGAYKGRIMFAVYFEDELVGWTGRSIYAMQEQRYKTLSNNPEKAASEGYPPAPAPITNFLLWYDKAITADADTIVLCEGPFDAWRVNTLSRDLGIVAVCLFTSMISDMQVQLLHELLPRFKRRGLLLDQNTLTQAIFIKEKCAALGLPIWQLPQGIKDPGDLTDPNQLEKICNGHVAIV